MSRLTTVLTLALVVSACGGSNGSSTPTSPTVPRPPDPTFTVSGVVVGQGSAPVEGAQVRVASQQGTTDGNGYYSLSGVPRSYGGVSAVKAGYAAAREILTIRSSIFSSVRALRSSPSLAWCRKRRRPDSSLLKACWWKNTPARMCHRLRLFSRALARSTFIRQRPPTRGAFTAFLDCTPATKTRSG
jgi:hypothetical protein